MLRARRESADRAREGAVDTRAAGDRLDIAALVDDLGEQQFGQIEAVDLDAELIRPGDQVWRRLGVDVIALVGVFVIWHRLFLV